MSRSSTASWRIRPLEAGDLEAVMAIDAQHTGRPKPAYWRRVFAELLEEGPQTSAAGKLEEFEKTEAEASEEQAGVDGTLAETDAAPSGEPPGHRAGSEPGMGPTPERIPRVGLAAEREGRLIGYLTGEVRAFEFGSEACGWVLAVGVDPAHTRERVASALLAAACRRFQEAGVSTVRTMVRRNDVPMLSFFRANGFVGGSFAQLELELPPSGGGSRNGGASEGS